jgi:hypothetical protein
VKRNEGIEKKREEFYRRERKVCREFSSEYLAQRRKGRKEIKLPNLAFLSSLREEIPPLVEPDLLRFFPVKAQRLRRRPVGDREENRVFVGRVLVRVPLPGRHDKNIALIPI